MARTGIMFRTFIFLVNTLLIQANQFEGLGDLAQVFSMLSGGNQCVLTCPKGHDPKPNPRHIPSSNGCGSMGIQLDTTDYPGFTNCCDEHDKCYDTCNTDRSQCDQVFKNCLKDACGLKSIHLQLTKDQQKKCNGVMELMYQSTVGLGCLAYKEAQRNACLCDGKTITKKDLENHAALSEEL